MSPSTENQDFKRLHFYVHIVPCVGTFHSGVRVERVQRGVGPWEKLSEEDRQELLTEQMRWIVSQGVRDDAGMYYPPHRIHKVEFVGEGA